MKSEEKKTQPKITMHIIFLKKNNILQVKNSQDSILVQTLLKGANALTFHQWRKNVKQTKHTQVSLLFGKRCTKEKLNP